MASVDEPLKDYENYFKDHHARNVSEYFEELVAASKVDEQENIKLIAQIADVDARKSKGASSRTWLRVARIASIVVASGLVALAVYLGGLHYLWILISVALVVLIFIKINPAVSSLNDVVAELEIEHNEKTTTSWSQMEPLNSLYSWATARKLFMKSFPMIELDEHMSAAKLQDLQKTYGLAKAFNDYRSVLSTQSGSLNGNPFVFAKYLHHWIGSKAYTGTLTIYWTEQTTNAQGDSVTVQRSQVLVATLNKPFPEFTPLTTLIYGHEAAPNLSFSRSPSSLSGLEDSLLNNWRKDHAIKKVEKAARKGVKSGNSEITVMANREFEALFNAVNRDNEIEFRLLFTPLAQQEMVALMNDKTQGFGDDFSFSKSGTVNFIEGNHLANANLESDVRMFYSNDLVSARAFFNNWHNTYFRIMYFAFAPLLTVPLYQEKRTLPAVKDSGKDLAFWEHEVLANYMGEAYFAHPESVTTNLLKTTAGAKRGDATEVTVTAFGYQGFPRLDFVPTLGGDGDIHAVPVHWIEYLPVEKDSSILVGVAASDDDEQASQSLQSSWSKVVTQTGASPEAVFARGVLGTVLLRR
jgi:hypothetical protein